MAKQYKHEHFESAKELVLNAGHCTQTMLQRKFFIGYNSSGRLIDELQREGIIGEYSIQNCNYPVISNEVVPVKSINRTPTYSAKQFQEMSKKGKKPSKYKNVKTKVLDDKGNVLFFDSKKEAKRYGELKILQKNGEIFSLELQKKYLLEVNGYLICKYISDFEYWCD